MTGKQSNILPTDEEPLSSLLSPDCEIPSDIQFEIFDEAGTLLGTLGGHKNLMALRSPVFKRMFYGPLKEKGDTVQVKFTSLVAFNALLKHIHGDTKKEDWEMLPIEEVAKIADIAERYDLPGLKSQTTLFAKNWSFPKEKLLETFCLAEQVLHQEFSEALKKNCEELLLATLGTPDDYNLCMKQNSGNISALSLLARVDHGKMAFVKEQSFSTVRQQEAIICIRNIKGSTRTRHYLAKLVKLVRDLKRMKDRPKGELKNLKDIINRHSQSHLVTVNSMKRAMDLDGERAAEKGIALSWSTTADGEEFDRRGVITFGQSVGLYLNLMRSTKMTGWLTWDTVSCLWNMVLSPSSLPDLKECLLKWLGENFDDFNTDSKVKISEALALVHNSVKDIPGYAGLHSVCVEHANHMNSYMSSDFSFSDSD